MDQIVISRPLVAVEETRQVIGGHITLLKLAKDKKKLHKEKVTEYLSADEEYRELAARKEELDAELKAAVASIMAREKGVALTTELAGINEDLKENKKSLHNLISAYSAATGKDEINVPEHGTLTIDKKFSLKAGQLKLF